MNKEIFNELVNWQKSNFPKATAHSKACHLELEVLELKDAIEQNDKEIRLEYADCFMLLFGSAAEKGMTWDDIGAAIQEKMAINKLRIWGEPDANGVVKHIEQTK